MAKEDKNPFECNKYEIRYNIINSAIAGVLVFIGTVADGSISATGILASLAAAMLAAVIKFKTYWDGEKGEYSKKLLNFI